MDLWIENVKNTQTFVDTFLLLSFRVLWRDAEKFMFIWTNTHTHTQNDNNNNNIDMNSRVILFFLICKETFAKIYNAESVEYNTWKEEKQKKRKANGIGFPY